MLIIFASFNSDSNNDLYRRLEYKLTNIHLVMEDGLSLGGDVKSSIFDTINNIGRVG
jgi:hypothetical protein